MNQSPEFAEENPTGEIVIYQTDEGKTKIEVRFVNETVWLSLDQMAMLFGVDKSGISRHLRNVFFSGELSEEAVVAIFATTAADGKTYQVKHYNLDAIIAVGYRVNSKRATQFRIWATSVLKEYIIKGFALNYIRDNIVISNTKTSRLWWGLAAGGVATLPHHRCCAMNYSRGNIVISRFTSRLRWSASAK